MVTWGGARCFRFEEESFFFSFVLIDGILPVEERIHLSVDPSRWVEKGSEVQKVVIETVSFRPRKKLSLR